MSQYVAHDTGETSNFCDILVIATRSAEPFVRLAIRDVLQERYFVMYLYFAQQKCTYSWHDVDTKSRHVFQRNTLAF